MCPGGCNHHAAVGDRGVGATDSDSGSRGARSQWFERVVGAGDIFRPADRLDDNIGKPRLAHVRVCDAFRIADSADLVIATRAARGTSSAAEQQLELEDDGHLDAWLCCLVCLCWLAFG